MQEEEKTVDIDTSGPDRYRTKSRIHLTQQVESTDNEHY